MRTYILINNSLVTESLKTESEGTALTATKYAIEIGLIMPLVLPFFLAFATFVPLLSQNCENRNILSKQQSHGQALGQTKLHEVRKKVSEPRSNLQRKVYVQIYIFISTTGIS